MDVAYEHRPVRRAVRFPELVPVLGRPRGEERDIVDGGVPGGGGADRTRLQIDVPNQPRLGGQASGEEEREEQAKRIHV
jgi:hypothetical protein